MLLPHPIWNLFATNTIILLLSSLAVSISPQLTINLRDINLLITWN